VIQDPAPDAYTPYILCVVYMNAELSLVQLRWLLQTVVRTTNYWAFNYITIGPNTFWHILIYTILFLYYKQKRGISVKVYYTYYTYA